MDFLALTKSTVFIIGPVSQVLGWIMDKLYEFCSIFGIYNIGLCIILFTLIVKLLMFPLTIKQQKSSKLMAVMNPEIQAIQKKYKGKSDQDSMMRQQNEIKAVYEKYGTSMTGGCLQLLIQMPILFALYQVISRVPAYVGGVRMYFDNIVLGLQQQTGALEKMSDLISSKGFTVEKLGSADSIVDFLYKFTPADWGTLSDLFPNISALIADNSAQIVHMNQFLGLNLTEAPGMKLSIALIIPILAGLSQWLSTKLMSANQPAVDPENTAANSMKSMNTIMPIMSAVFCVTFPIGIGIYWIASSVFQILQQLIVNAYMSRMDIDELVERNLEKQNKKRAKKGLPPQKISKAATMNLKNLEADEERKARLEAERKAKTEERIKASKDFYESTEPNPTSLAAKARMVKKYNEKNSK